MASRDDKYQYVGNPGTATTLSAPGYTAGGTSMTVGSTTNWPTLTCSHPTESSKKPI